ncbi:MAG TPA: Ig-like domain repeat protein [Thermoanaerobaculia bacterium]|nr:Ig-like domain repeat protein [Thermoanaerobaculia bacterium]
MRVTRVLAGVIVTAGLLVSSSVSAAVRGEIPQRIEREFPSLSAALDAPASGAKVRVTSGKRFIDPVVVETATQRVVLRALEASPVERDIAGGGSAYARGFRGTDVLRTTRNGSSYEVLVANDRRAAEGVAYNVASLTGVKAIVPFGRSARFLAERPGAPRSDITLSAPVLIDADGRVSRAARWVVRNGGSQVATVRIAIDDPMLRYPVAIAWSHSTAGQADRAIARVAPRVPVSNGTGSVAGHVSDATSGAPLVFANVDLYFDNGEYAGAGIANENGDYIIDGLDTGSYRALVIHSDYSAELYDDVACNGACDLNAGTPIAVVDGARTLDIDFALSRTASAAIAGTVLDVNSNPLVSVGIGIYDETGAAAGFADTDENGNYRALLSGGGTYYARTHNDAYPGAVDELYAGIDCTGCDVLTGTPISVASGETTSGIDFSLTVNGGAISGSIADAGSNTAITFARVLVYNAAGRLVTFAYPNENGVYTTYNGLTAGNYYAVGSAYGYDSELYEELPCEACDPTTGTAIAVTAGATTSDVDFTLSGALARATGTITDSISTQPLGGVYVQFYDQNGEPVIAAESSFEDGTYVARLPAGGTYYARTFNYVQEGYSDELYDNIACTSCDVTTGTAIEIEPGTVTTGIDFALSQTGGWIAGKVLDTGNAAIADSYVIIYGADGSIVSYAIPDANGDYNIFGRLETGTYYAVASAERFDSQLFDGISCANGCDPVADGTAISVTAGQTTTGVDFFLAPVGCGILHIEPETLPDGNVGASYSQTLTLQGGSGPATWSLVDGALPPGLTFNTSTAEISGTLDSAGTYNFVINAADGTCVAARGYRINVIGQPTTITLEVFPNPTQYGQATTLIATVSPEDAEGTVNFTVDGIGAGSATLVDGVATVDVLLALGVREIVAAYTGGGVYSGSVTDPPIFVTVEKGRAELFWPDPAPIVYGTELTDTQLNATVVVNNEDPDATIGGTFSYDPPAGTILDAGEQTLSVTFTPNDTDLYDPTTATVTLVVEKAGQTITWDTPADITYGEALSSAQLNATVTVVGPAAAGALTYDPDFGTILDAGTQTLTVTAAETNNYNEASANVSLVVHKANQTINWADPADIVYGTALSETQLNATVTVVGPAAAGELTYTPAAGTLLNAGTHTLGVVAAETQNYNEASASVTLVVLKADPVYSNLSAPTIVIGTATTSIGGTLSFGTFIPTGSVDVTFNGSTVAAAIGADGSFSATFNTGTLAPSSSGYPIAFDYAGDANFNPASASSTLIVTYGIAGGPNPPNASVNAGATLPMRFTLRNAAGTNISSNSIVITAYGVRPAGGGAWIPITGTFNFQNAQGGQYAYNLKTPNTLTSGAWEFGFTVANDPVIHTVPFTVR